MGSPADEKGRHDDECQHQVTVADFLIGKYPVTQKQWRDVMGRNPSCFNGCDNCPVEHVSDPLKRPPQGVFFYIGKCKSITAPIFSKWARIYSVYIGGASLCVASVGIYTKIGVYIYGNGGCRAAGFFAGCLVI